MARLINHKKEKPVEDEKPGLLEKTPNGNEDEKDIVFVKLGPFTIRGLAKHVRPFIWAILIIVFIAIIFFILRGYNTSVRDIIHLIRFNNINRL